MGSKSYRAGDTATVTFVRDGQVMTTELTFGSTTDMPQQDQAQPSSQQTLPEGYGDMNDFLEEFFGGRSGGAA